MFKVGTYSPSQLLSARMNLGSDKGSSMRLISEEVVDDSSESLVGQEEASASLTSYVVVSCLDGLGCGDLLTIVSSWTLPRE